jgi:hypothetical protein
MDDLARQQAVLTSAHTLAARRLYELIQTTIRSHSYIQNRARIIELLDQAAAAAAALGPIDAAQRQASEERLAAARAQAAAEREEQRRQHAEAKAAVRARDRRELATIRHHEGL